MPDDMAHETLPKRTLAMVLTGPRALEPRDLAIPEIDDDSGILRVEACGICGSDYEQFEGVLRTPVPVIPGHEPLGRIAAIGDRAARRWGVEVGDRVAVENMISCRFCTPCLGGRSHLCEKRLIYSYVPLSQKPGLYGAYAEYMWLHPNSVLHKIEAALPAALAVMFNPLGAGFRWAVEIPETKPGRHRRDPRPGPARARERARVPRGGRGHDHRDGPRGRREEARARARVRRRPHDRRRRTRTRRKRIRELTNGRGADVVIDVSSYALEPVAASLDYVAAGGAVVLAGVKGFKPVPEFVSDKIVMKEIRVLGAIGVTSSAYRAAIRLLESRATAIEKMHTHDFGLRYAERAIHMLAREIPGEESIHSCLVPGMD